MSELRSVTGVLQLPDCRLNFYLSFDRTGPKGETAKKIGKIMDQASELSPEMKEVLIKFADFLEKHAEKPIGQDHDT